MENGPGMPDSSILIEDSDDGDGKSAPKRRPMQTKDLVWLSPECRVPLSQITDNMISTLIVTCTACGHQINHHKCKIYLHRHLNVIVCKRCYRYYGNGCFKKDSSGADEYCTWCAEGGSLLICDRCSRAFCKNCIRRNLTRRELSRVMALDTWHCYVCVPDQIAEIIRFARTIQEYATKDQTHHCTAFAEMADNRGTAEETVSNVVEQLRLLASALESDAKKGPAQSLLKRAPSLLKRHAKSVFKIAEGVEFVRRKQTRSKAEVNMTGVELGQGDVACVNQVGKDNVEEAKGHGEKESKKILPHVDTSTFLDVPKTEGNEGKRKTNENSEKEVPVLPLVRETDGIAPVQEVGVRNTATDGIVEEKTGMDENEAEVGKGGAASAGPNDFSLDHDRVETAIDGLETHKIFDGSPLVLNLGTCSDTTRVENDGETEKQSGESKAESPSLLDELFASVEEIAKIGYPVPDAGNGTAQVEKETDLEELHQRETELDSQEEKKNEEAEIKEVEKEHNSQEKKKSEETEVKEVEKEHNSQEEKKSEGAEIEEVEKEHNSHEEEKSEEAEIEEVERDHNSHEEKKCGEAVVKEVEKDEDSSVSEGCKESGSHVETESSESEAMRMPKRQSKGRSPRKRAPLTENEKARRALQRSLRATQTDSSSSEDDELQDSKAKLSPRVCKTTPPKRGRHPTLMETPSKNSDDGKESQRNLHPDDPKLRSKAVVVVDKLNLDFDEIMGTALEEKASLKGGSSDEDEIAGLLTMPGKVKQRKATVYKAEEKRTKKRPKGKAGMVTEDLESDRSSGKAPVSDGEDVPSGQKSPEDEHKTDLKSKNELSKEALLKSILQSSESSAESEEEILPIKKKRPKNQAEAKDKGKGCEEEEGEEVVVLESEEEVVGSKKRKKLQKYQKLLYQRTTVPSDDTTEKEKEGSEKGQDTRKAKPRKRCRLTFSDEDSSAANNAEKEESEESSSEDSSHSTTSSSGVSSGVRNKKRRTPGTQNTKGRRKKRKETSSSTESEKPKKKRRRIKVAASTDKDGDSDSGNDVVTTSQGGDGKGRKNIRKVLTDKELHKRTKLAAQAEEERKKRIRERQKLYNEAMGTATNKGDFRVDQLVLEMNTETKEVTVEVNPSLVQCMKPHQTKGVKFMYDCTIETVEMLAKEKKGSGAILAHCMGLGKTFQVISFLHTVLTNKETKKHLRTALVVCPYNTVLNWVREFELWLGERDLDLTVHEISAIKDNYTRVDVLNLWQSEGGVLIMGYDKFRLLVNAKGKRFSSKMRDGIEKTLLDPGPDLVVCDEGHVLKNDTTGLSKAMSRIRTNRRIVLTGTPLQNNLSEYHCMVSFVKPNLLGTKKEFLNRFVNPIRNGQCADSTVMDVKLMKKRVHILHSLLDGCVQRCDYSALAPFLPPKYEYVISVRLSEPQVALYRYFLDNLARNKGQKQRIAMGVLADYHTLRNVWTHPYLLEVSAARAAAKEALESEDDFIDDQSTAEEGSDKAEVVCLDDAEPSTSKANGRQNGGDSSEEEIVKPWHTRSRGTVDEDAELQDSKQEPEQREKAKMWWNHIVPDDEMEKLEVSGKIMLLCKILQECDAIGDKVLLFSQSLSTLDMIEKMLHQFEERATAAEAEPMALININDPLRDCQNTWSVGVDYFRMDGSTSVDLRKRWIELFNSEDNPRARLFLISTKAGSLGTNLVGANRVVLMDASWNPTHDVQAIFRVYRFGQKKPVYIYRLLAQGTMEEKIYDRQVTKQSLSCRVVDEQQIERHFNAADLQELYSFDPDSKSNRPTPMVPKDRLLAELLIRHKEWIVTYHEHDSLLQNVTEEDLTEEERKAAWEEYNAEREGRLRTNLQEATAGLAQQQATPNTSGTGRQFTLDLNKIISEIRRQNPNITQEQLAINLKNALLLFRSQFRRQQMDAFNQRSQYLKYKQPVPQEVTDRLGESSMAIQQLNSVLAQLDRSITAQNARMARGNFQQFPRAPNAAPPQQQGQRPGYIPQQFVRMQYNAWTNQYRQYKQAQFQQFPAGSSGSSIPIISEVEDVNAAPGPAQKPSTSSVTITEIID